MTQKQEAKMLTEYAISRCMDHLGFTPQKNQIHLLEGGFETVNTSMGPVTIPDYVLFHVGANSHQIRCTSTDFEILE